MPAQGGYVCNRDRVTLREGLLLEPQRSATVDQDDAVTASRHFRLLKLPRVGPEQGRVQGNSAFPYAFGALLLRPDGVLY